MAKIIHKAVKSEYKYVWGRIYYDKPSYIATVGRRFGKRRESERDAAKDADMMLIDLGKEPVNILKRK